MDGELKPRIENLELRLEVLRELADSLKQAQAAVLRSDLSGLQAATALQSDICGRYRQVVCSARHLVAGPELCGVDFGRDASASPALRNETERWNALSAEIARMEQRALELNRAYSALLRRARRTVDIFCRALASSSPTYGPPPRPVVPLIHCCEEV